MNRIFFRALATVQVLVLLCSMVAMVSIPAYSVTTTFAGALTRSDGGSFGLLSPKYTEWSEATAGWSISSPAELPPSESKIVLTKLLFSSVLPDLRVGVTLSINGDLNLYKCPGDCLNSSNWTRIENAPFANVGAISSATPSRPFDVTLEKTSGKFIIVYDKSVTEQNDLYIRTFDGITLSAETGFNAFGGTTNDAELIRYITMASKPTAGSNEITMTLLDSTNKASYAFIWNNATSTFSNAITIAMPINSKSVDYEPIGVAYQTNSGASVVFSAGSSNMAKWARWDGTSWSGIQSIDPNPNGSGLVKFVSMKGDPVTTSDKIMVCQGDSASDLTCAQFDGMTFGSWVRHDASINNKGNTRAFDFTWKPSGSTGRIVWATTNDHIEQKEWNSFTSTWASEPTAPGGKVIYWLLGMTNTIDSDITKSLFLDIAVDNTSATCPISIGAYRGTDSGVGLIGPCQLGIWSDSPIFEGMSLAFRPN